MKAVFVMNMPESCKKCPLFDFEYKWCNYLDEQVLNANGARDKNCPLKKLPEKLIPEMVLGNAFAEGCCQGWNDCIDEITGDSK